MYKRQTRHSRYVGAQHPRGNAPTHRAQHHAQTDFEKRKRLQELEDEEKTSKNRARRERKKLAAQRAKQQQKGNEEPGQKRRLVAPDAVAEPITLRRPDEPVT